MSLNRRYIAALILVMLPMATILLMSLGAMETRAAETVFTYDDLGRLSTVTNSGSDESVYTYDKTGNIMYVDGDTVLPSIYPFIRKFLDVKRTILDSGQAGMTAGGVESICRETATPLDSCLRRNDGHGNSLSHSLVSLRSHFPAGACP
jgi:YD repeat-containing protein